MVTLKSLNHHVLKPSTAGRMKKLAKKKLEFKLILVGLCSSSSFLLEHKWTDNAYSN